MNDTPYIKSLRQKRAIDMLLSRDSIQVKNMDSLIGSLNSRQTIMELRHQGFSEIILMRRFYVKDRDGKICHPGEYYVLPEHKHVLEEVLVKYTATASVNAAAVVQEANDSRGEV